MIISKVLARSVLALGTVCCLTATPGAAQEVYSSIIGAVSMKAPAGSDLYVTPSFNNSAVFRSDVTAATAGSVTFSSAAFDADAYASGHHLLIEEGALAGRMFEITSNTATVLTVSDPDNELAAAADQLASIVPALTLGEMFPNGLGGKVEVNPGNPDLFLFSNDNSAGVEGFAPKDIYYYGDIAKDGDEIISQPGWRKVGAPLWESHDDDILPLGQGFVVRNNSGVDVSFFLFGEVMLSQVQIPIASKSAGATDNLVGVPRPLAIAIGDLGLESVVTVTASANAVSDTVRIFPSDPSSKNPAPDVIYCLYSDGWREVVDGVVVTSGDALDSALVPAASAVVIRKVATTEDQVVYWTNSWSLPSQS